MLPSRLYRNTGVPPALRSLVTPKATLPAPIAVQLRLRLGVLSTQTLTPSSRWVFVGARRSASTAATPEHERTEHHPMPGPSSSDSSHASYASIPLNGAPQPLHHLQVEPRLSITFTCTVPACGHRSSHEFTKRAYTKGIVIVQCPGCKSKHLIADNLGWFKESTEDGKHRTVEDLLRAKGESVRRGKVGSDGVVEFVEDE